jgi:hypothetical protein
LTALGNDRPSSPRGGGDGGREDPMRKLVVAHGLERVPVGHRPSRRACRPRRGRPGLEDGRNHPQCDFAMNARKLVSIEVLGPGCPDRGRRRQGTQPRRTLRDTTCCAQENSQRTRGTPVSGGSPDPDLGFQARGLDEPEDTVDGDLLEAPREDASHRGTREPSARSELGMGQSPAIDLTKYSSD